MIINHVRTKRSRIALLSLSAACLALAPASVQAGFEWVPPQKKEPAPIITPPSQPVDGAAPAPAVQPEGYELSPLSPMPLMEDEIVAAPIPAPPPVQPSVEQPVSGKPVLKVKTMIEPEEVPAQTAPAQEAILQPMPSPTPAPSPRIVMPQDAPEKAVESVPGGNRLIIEPFPQEQAAGHAQGVPPVALDPVSAPAAEASQPSAYEDAVGFGSDMPLALALQQIAPPSYAVSFGESVNPGARVSWTGGKPWNEVISEMLSPLHMEADIRGRVIHIRYSRESALRAPAAEQTAVSADTKAAPVQIDRTGIRDPGEQVGKQPAQTIHRIENAG